MDPRILTTSVHLQYLAYVLKMQTECVDDKSLLSEGGHMGPPVSLQGFEM